MPAKQKRPVTLPVLFASVFLLLFASCAKQREYRQIESFMNESTEWSQQLYSRGEEIGRLLAGLIQRKVDNGDKARKRIESFQAYVAAGREDFNSRDLPDLPEFTAYREKFDEYLKWESEVIAENMADLIEVLERDDLSQAEKRDLLMDLANEMSRDEDIWKKDLDGLRKTLLKKVNE